MIDGASPAGIKAAYDALQSLIKIRDWTQNADAKLAVANALNGLADAKIELSQLKIENENLRSELKELNSNISEINALERCGVLLFDSKNKLFKCPTCAEKYKELYTLSPHRYDNPYQYKCNNCSSEFISPDYRESGWSDRSDYNMGGF